MSVLDSSAAASVARVAGVLRQNHGDLLHDWVAAQTARTSAKMGDLKSQCEEFLGLLDRAAPTWDDSPSGDSWRAVEDFLKSLSRSRAQQGFTPTQTATFVFALKKPLFQRLRRQPGIDADLLAEDLQNASEMLDALGLYTAEMFAEGREELISRQQQDMMELSTPVVTLWEGVLALPVIGTLDSARTQVVMENLLQRIVDTGTDIAIIDITGVATVDTLTAQHLLKTVTAARLMGAECIISGVRPQIAQTIVHLGVDLSGVITKATLADAFRVALSRSGRAVVRVAAPGGGGAMARAALPDRSDARA